MHSLPIVLTLATSSLAAQCATQWLPGDRLASTNGVVMTTTRWDPDGPGPAGERLVVAGDFSWAGDLAANRIAAYDPATDTWSAFGPGLDGMVRGVVALPNGDLVAGGDFATAGGVTVQSVARWDGTAWQPMQGGMSPGGVFALAVTSGGEVIAGGRFLTAGGTSAPRVARWDGASWHALGNGLENGFLTGCYALCVLSNGDIVAGGDFNTAGGSPAANIARWNGSAWTPLGAGVDAAVLALQARATGELVVGGGFLHAGGVYAQYLAQWSGTSWSVPQLPWLGSPAYAMTTLANGDTVITTAGGVATWNGTTLVGDPLAPQGGLRTVGTMPGGNLVVGGEFPVVGTRQVPYLAQRAATGYEPVGSSSALEGNVFATAVLPNGDLVAGGDFVRAGGVSCAHLARRVGNAWQPLGVGTDGTVRALAVLPNGDLVAAGTFSAAGGVSCQNIARWNGVAWSPLGSGLTATGGFTVVRALLVRGNGDLVAAGQFQAAGGIAAAEVAVWNGATWAALGAGVVSTPLFAAGATALAELPNGDLAVGGSFFQVGGAIAANTGVALWNGTAWTASPIQGSVSSLAVLRSGELVAGGFGLAPRVLTPAGWQLLGTTSASPFAMVVLPDGDLLVSGATQRWNGATWTAVPGGPIVVYSFATLPDGTVVAGGSHVSSTVQNSASVAWLASSCPATAVSVGVGCSGAGGANVLTATSLPWGGGSASAQVTGLSANSFALRELGFTPVALSLPALLPQALPGCSLYVLPDYNDLWFPTAGSVTASLAIPDSVVFAGLVLREQFVAFEFVGGTFAAITSSNAIDFTIGVF